jgi:hypothetical protein
MSELSRMPPNKPLDLTVGYAARRSTAPGYAALPMPWRHDDLESELRAAGVQERAYSLDHQPIEGDQYCIKCTRRQPDRWEVYFSERGRQRDLRVFDDEQAAAAAFYEWVVSDPTTQRERHPTP